jgi:Ca2+-binding RTX toxin-like protein
MTATFITSNSSAAITLAGNGDSLALIAGVTLASAAFADAVALSGSTSSRSVFIDGHVVSSTARAISLGSFDDILLEGIASASSVISIGASGGLMARSSGVGGFASSLNLMNAGSISAVEEGVLVSGQKNHVYNSGDISAGQIGVELSGKTCSVVNTGSIYGGSFAVLLRGEGLLLNNSGDISGPAGDVVRLISDIDASAKIVNSGTIDGSVTETLGKATLVNTGVITGDIDLGAGDDTFKFLTGVVGGNVAMGDGNDTIILGASVDVDVSGGAGVDTLSVARSTVLSLGIENLSLRGGDNLRGTGTLDANIILGNRGNNTLSGLGGADTLNGLGGNDFLIGGTAKDGVRDVFVFGMLCGADTIRGYQIKGAGDDRIDLNDFARNDAFDSFADLKTNFMRQSGKNVIIDLPGDDQVTIENVTLADFKSSDFIF